MEIKGDQYVLTVNKTDLTDTGVYTAIIDNGIQKLEMPVNLLVGGKHGNQHVSLEIDHISIIF